MADKNGNGVTGDIPIATVRSELLAIIRKKNQKATEDGFITREELKIARQEYIESILKKEKGELNKIDKQVVKSLVEHESIVKDIMQEKENLTVGQKLADGVAKFGGSWGFIISFGVFLIIWIGINSYFLLQKPYDPYPFILLNLILSCLAALQAPIIMMSQNRQAKKDSLISELDYKLNLKSEIVHEETMKRLNKMDENQKVILGNQIKIMNSLNKDKLSIDKFDIEN